ncbi:MAG: dipicolinate synthase subunit DpsA [Clostridia bacterium]|nr:dipicolinate synthase subunit DpsA [Clostridia bacterium]
MNFSIIGGDLRTVKLAEMLSKDNQVYVYGINTIWNKSEEVDTNKFDIDKGTNKIKICKDIKEAIDKSKIVLGPVPLSKDGENLNAPFCKENIKIREIIEQINDSEKTFIAGGIKENVYEIAKNIKIIDLMEQEELTVLNTIATAEGTIQVAIENTEINIQGSEILILGFGRVGKVVAKKFKALDANITCAARKKQDIAWIETLGYESTNINTLSKNLERYNIIINTVPKVILTKNELSYINNNALIIDLASKPGGVDQKVVRELKLNYIWALALPGKVSPLTSAVYIKNTIYNILGIYN